MNHDLDDAMRALQEEKNISKEDLLKMIEASLAAAYRRDFGNKMQNIQAIFDPSRMSMKVFDVKQVVEDSMKESEDFNPQTQITASDAVQYDSTLKIGDEMRIELEPPTGINFGRVAAQTAKQVIMQKIREAERSNQFTDLKAKERTLVNGVVQRIESGAVFIDIGKITGILFPSEQVKSEKYEVGQRMKTMILHVEASPKGPKITLSRNHPDIIRRLFEQEVPEINDGTVEIKAIAREAGSRTKIAVISYQEGIDPIGSCIGQKGARINTIISELGGSEKVDIIEWSEDPIKFVASSLSPAKIISAKVDFDSKNAEVTVFEDQLSLAIGKNGQNVRLAARLTGWKIDIKVESIKQQAPQAEEVTQE